MDRVVARRRVVWAAHAVMAGGAAVLLWAFSVPGFSVLVALAGLAVLGVAALLWTVGAQLSHSAGRTWPWWLLVAPVLAVVTLALLVTRAPLHVRWELSRGAFESVVADLPEPTAATRRDPVEVPDRVGSYRIIRAYLVPGGVIFYEGTGAFFDDAGFAYLPGGPTPSLHNGSFESPSFQSLGDGWYRWTASW
ncbi:MULTISPECIES: hypothetical protein [Micromonospora]|uniref:hypothetical protein n=1 Tax=Micromonospora TaxID=1873 RepID=UPI000D6F61B4|nr:hypothetical protein [Micromonospora sp. S4605]PWU47055.1 hypothetical protein DLJ47_31335 [Micromonospora sp. S4605]